MQEILNREFLDLSEDRSYPLDQMATGYSDQKTTLPNDIIADIRLTLDPSLGSSVFVASVVVSGELVNVTLVATDHLQSKPSDLDYERYGADAYIDPGVSPYFNAAQDEAFLLNTTPTFTRNTSRQSSIIPIAVITAPLSDTNKGKPIRVEPLVDGVGGWMVFGRDIKQHAGNNWSFSHVSQSAIARRGVHFLNFSRVKTAGKYKENNTLTSGVVTLDGENGLQVTQKTDTALCLTQTGDPPRCQPLTGFIERDTLEIGFAGDNLKANLERYTGPCGVRPDSASCYRGQPITSINGVKPVPSDITTNEAYKNCIFLIFPQDLECQVLSWHQKKGSVDDLDSGFILKSTALPVSTVCKPQNPEVDDDGGIGTDDCCEDCDHDCTPQEGVANVQRGMRATTSSTSSSGYSCLSTNLLTIHEYNHTIDATVRTHLTYIGTVATDYVYAQDTSNLASGYVIYIDDVTGSFTLNQNGTTLTGLSGSLVSDYCRSNPIKFIDETGHTVTLTAAPKSVFLTAPSAAHTPLVDVLYTGTSATTVNPSGNYCEKQYGRYVKDSSTYELSVTPHHDPTDVVSGTYPYTLYNVDAVSGNKVAVYSGTLLETSVSGTNTSSAAKPTPRLDSGAISFKVGADTYAGTIYSNTESSACGDD
jgi:hypothetical protein